MTFVPYPLTLNITSTPTTMSSEPPASSKPVIELRDLQPGDLGWVLQAHGEQYWQEYGWNQEFERLVARVLGEFCPGERERGWIATVDGERAGCIFLVRAPSKDQEPVQSKDAAGDAHAPTSSTTTSSSTTADSTTKEGEQGERGDMAKLRLLLVDSKFRGLGLASLLVDACLAFAREKGYRGVELWTHANLTAARGMYAKRGFCKVKEEPYTGLGGHELVAEEWELLFPSSFPSSAS